MCRCNGSLTFVRAGLAWLLLAFSAPAFAAERIIRFDSAIQVLPDASITVTETIVVQAEGNQIRRGIFREIPTRYRDRLGNRFRVQLDVIDVERNGRPEPFHVEERANGIVIYMGSAGSYIPQGKHEYRLRYRSNRQLGFFADHDELYWNVTGNGWAFPIERASARIILPEAVGWDQLTTDLYTGPQGARGDAGEIDVLSGREIRFTTNATLPPRHGLTVAVGWPKGIVEQPGLAQRVTWFFSDNGGALVLLLGLALPLAWYLRSWNAHGRDPRKGVIIPRFQPPEGLSAAGCRYVLDMGLRGPAFTAAIVSLGVKGHLRIDEQDDDFVLYRAKEGRHEVTDGEAAVLTELLPEEDDWIELDDEHYRKFQRARSGLETALRAEHKNRLFKLNTIFMVPAVLLSLLALVVGVALGAAPFAWVLFVAGTLVMHLAFLFLLRAPTPLGRRVMDEIEGFRMYLDTAERDRLDRMRSPDLTPEVFEMFLPFAFALGVENRWCQRFAREFPREAREYESGWYNGSSRGTARLGHIGSRLGQGFTSAISSASSPPGSSSGSGGGGSSGGGGGGGGGGGW
ncbi:MAG: DUF2207 domain-containing protein [Xanthomonadales bacterium]|nr:DUF2207 domain-containing protein [Xanthomonadales bacterium]